MSDVSGSDRCPGGEGDTSDHGVTDLVGESSFFPFRHQVTGMGGCIVIEGSDALLEKRAEEPLEGFRKERLIFPGVHELEAKADF